MREMHDPYRRVGYGDTEIAMDVPAQKNPRRYPKAWPIGKDEE